MMTVIVILLATAECFLIRWLYRTANHLHQSDSDQPLLHLGEAQLTIYEQLIQADGEPVETLTAFQHILHTERAEIY